ncbi:MAG: 50S ribosomal protein L18 [Patescibacteria group bacterium]
MRPILHNQTALLRVKRSRARITGTHDVPRLAVHRGLKTISAQLIDDGSGTTLCAAAERELSAQQRKGTKTERAQVIGALLAKKAKDKHITRIVFDRRGNKYHGRVKAFADAAREGGLEF